MPLTKMEYSGVDRLSDGHRRTARLVVTTVEFAYPPTPVPVMSMLKFRALYCGDASVNWRSPGIHPVTTSDAEATLDALMFPEWIGRHVLLLS